MICKCCESTEVKILVLYGPPGAGKGTIAQYLLDNYNVVHFSTGNLLRNEVKNDTAIGKKVASILGSGGLVDDDIVNTVIESNLLNTLLNDNIVLLDGYPRTVEQAKFLDIINGGKLKSMIRVIEIEVDHEVVISRITKRLVCAQCGSTFNSSQLMADGGNVSMCERCGGSLIRRADDSEAVVRNRLEEYTNVTLPVSAYYAERVIKIFGNETPKKVSEGVDAVLGGFGIKKRR